MDQSIETAVPMSEEAIASEMDKIVPGSRVVIRYKKSAEPAVLIYLVGMATTRKIILPHDPYCFGLRTIAEVGDWVHDGNRVVELLASTEYDAMWFRDRVLGRIDYIKVS